MRPAEVVDHPGRPRHLRPTGRWWGPANDIQNIRPAATHRNPPGSPEAAKAEDWKQWKAWAKLEYVP